MTAPTAVTVVIFGENNTVLLHKREDFRVWCLPGGHQEPLESWEQTAIREAFEETGYRIAVDRLVGEYWQPQLPNGGKRRYVCTGRIVGGEAIQRGAETVQVKWFDVNHLPFSYLDSCASTFRMLFQITMGLCVGLKGWQLGRRSRLPVY